MNEVSPKAGRKTRGPRSMLAKNRRPNLDGEITYITIPNPPPSGLNKNRPISGLIKAQLEHIHHAESARLPKDKRAGIDLKDIRTEAEAASYIAAVTRVLHPLRRTKRSRLGTANAAS